MNIDNNMKHQLPNEIKDLVLLNYNFEVAYNVVDDNTGDSYSGNDTIIEGQKYFLTEEECKAFLENVKEYPNEEFDADNIDVRAEYSHIEEDNSTSKKISLIDYFNEDSNSCLRYLNEFFRNNPDYKLVGDFKLVKKTNLTN